MVLKYNGHDKWTNLAQIIILYSNIIEIAFRLILNAINMLNGIVPNMVY